MAARSLERGACDHLTPKSSTLRRNPLKVPQNFNPELKAQTPENGLDRHRLVDQNTD